MDTRFQQQHMLSFALQSPVLTGSKSHFTPYVTLFQSKCAAFFAQFFSVKFLVELDITSTGCVALCCVALCCLLHIVLCCVVMLCVMICLLLTLVCWLKISQFSCSFVARLDATTRRTYNRSTSSTSSTNSTT